MFLSFFSNIRSLFIFILLLLLCYKSLYYYVYEICCVKSIHSHALLEMGAGECELRFHIFGQISPLISLYISCSIFTKVLPEKDPLFDGFRQFSPTFPRFYPLPHMIRHGNVGIHLATFIPINVRKDKLFPLKFLLYRKSFFCI